MTTSTSFPKLTSSIHLTIPHFHLDISTPSLLIRLPCHPSFEHLTSTGDVRQEFLEVDIFVPDVVDTGEEGHGSVDCGFGREWVRKGSSRGRRTRTLTEVSGVGDVT